MNGGPGVSRKGSLMLGGKASCRHGSFSRLSRRTGDRRLGPAHLPGRPGHLSGHRGPGERHLMLFSWAIYNPPPSGSRLSADGRYAVFSSDASNLIAGLTDTNNGPDLYLHDRIAGTTVLVTRSAGDPLVTSNGSSATAGISPSPGRSPISFPAKAWTAGPMPSSMTDSPTARPWRAARPVPAPAPAAVHPTIGRCRW